MEKSETTSGYLFEDEFSFITAEGTLFLKEQEHIESRKLAEFDLGEDNKVETGQVLEPFKKTYRELESRIQSLAEKDTVSLEELNRLKEEIKGTDGIGDFDALINQVDKIKEDQKQEQESETAPEQEQKDEAGANEKEAEENPLQFYSEIVEKAEKLSSQDDWPYVSMELDNLSREWEEGPDIDDDKEVKKLYESFQEAVDTFEKRKQEHYEQLKKQKQENLQKKKNLVSELETIVSEEKWSSTGKVNKIKGQWNSIGVLPSDAGEALDTRYKELLETFDEHKVDRLVEQRQKEEDNLALKLVVLDKMEKIAGSLDKNTTHWKKIDEKFEDLTVQWKKIGRVPREKANEVWPRYKAAQDDFYDRKYKFDEKHRKKVDKFKSKKEKLCKEAEALIEADDLANAARKINKLHHRWKKVGNLPQRDEDELWSRFKKATDEFNELKSSKSDLIRKQEEKHYQKKLELIEEAEAIKDTEDWDKGHRTMQSLMDRWKNVGPVPRKKSQKIWKQFKGAMDHFYDRRREHFKEVKEERKENLKEKQEILEKLRELGRHDDPIEAVEIAKPLQEKFKSAGYVPINKKDKMWKQYREACDVIYDRFRAAKSGNKFDQELAKADLDTEQRSKIQDMRKKYKKIKKEVRKLEDEVLQYKETKTYFKPTDKGNALIEEIQQKIDKAEHKIQEKQEKMDNLAGKMEEIKADA